MRKSFAQTHPNQKKTFNKKPVKKVFSQANADARKAFAAGEVMIMNFFALCYKNASLSVLRNLIRLIDFRIRFDGDQDPA